jgi:hypothetical protein
MPQLLAFVAPTLFAAGGSAALITGAGGLTGLGIATSIGGSLLLSTASNALFATTPASATPQNIKLVLKQSTGPRLLPYGRNRLGGTVTFFRSRGGKFYRVIAHSEGPIDAIETYIVDSKDVTRDAGTGAVTTEQYVVDTTNLLNIQNRLGATDSAHYSEITTVWPDYDDTHDLRGVFSTLMVAESVGPDTFRDVYPRNEPSLEVVCRGLKIYDPRTDTTVWTENPALIMADYIQRADGMNQAGTVDATVLSAAANEFDETFTLAAGGTEARCRLSGVVSLAEDASNSLKRMRASSGAEIGLLPNGQIGIYSPKFTAPTVSISRSQIVSLEDFDGGPTAVNRYTELPFTYTDPDLGFQTTGGDPWIDATRETANGQIAIGPEMNYDMCPSHAQGRYLASRQIEIDNPAYTLKVKLKPSGRLAMFERYVEFDADVSELPDVYWRVMSFDLDFAGGGVTLNLASFVSVERDSANDGTAQALPTPDVGDVIPVPTNATASGAGLRISQSSYAAGIGVAWDARPSVALAPRLEYALAGTDNFTEWKMDATSRQATIAPLADGSDYDVRLYYEASGNRRSAYVKFDDVTATANTDTPGVPTNFTVTDQTGGQAAVALTTADSDNLWKTEVLRDSVLIKTYYQPRNTAVSFTDAPGAGTYAYVARSINVSGTPSADVTVTRVIT